MIRRLTIPRTPPRRPSPSRATTRALGLLLAGACGLIHPAPSRAQGTPGLDPPAAGAGTAAPTAAAPAGLQGALGRLGAAVTPAATAARPQAPAAPPQAPANPAAGTAPAADVPGLEAGDDAPRPFEGLALPTPAPAAEAAPAPAQTPIPAPATPAAPVARPQAPATQPAAPAAPRGAGVPDFEPTPTPADGRIEGATILGAEGDDAPLRDDGVTPAQAPGEVNPGLPPAKEPPPGASAPAGGNEQAAGDSYVPQASQLKTGPNAVGVTVEVRAPEVVNRNRESVFIIIVRNSGPTDATNLMVRYNLPETIDFVSSEPTLSRQVGPLCLWQLNSLNSGAEKIIRVKIRAKGKGDLDHAVTVSMQAGARARSVVREPQLKIEMRPDKTSPMRGDTVTFDLSVSNFGDFPARDVKIEAKLGPGLDHPRGRDLVLPLRDVPGHEKDTIAPGETVNVRLEVDTKAMGKQPIDVKVVSADLPAEVVASTQIEVVEPQLNLELVGPDERYPDSKGTYRIVLTNTGTAAARDVIVAAQVPVGGQPLAVTPRGATWSAQSRTFTWKVSEVPPQERQEFTIDVQMGRVGTYTVRAGTKAERVPAIQRLLTTHIKGAPKLRFSVSESRGVLDEGETTDVEIRLRNDGSKEATNIQITGQLVGDTMQVLGVIGADGKLLPPAAGQAPNLAMLPLVDRLPPGAEVTLTVRIKALKAGDGTCQVTILHDDIPKPGLSQTVITRVTPASGLRK